MSRFLGLDYGTKRIGVAISDPTFTLASPLPYLDATPFTKVIGKLKEIIREKEVSQIIIGIPRNMDGSYGPASDNAKEFALRLKEMLTVPVKAVDERLSTVEASRRLHESGKKSKEQRAVIDSSSAVIILQSYLDSPVDFR